MIKQAVSCSAALGLDVGESSHWACLVTRLGEVLANRPVANREEDPQVRVLARRIREAQGEAERLDGAITALLERDGTYGCLMTVPGIGARAASRCGIAPRNRQSGTSISSVCASRQGNKRLKNLLIFSCNSLVRSRNRFGDYYRRCRESGMCHGEALKAEARKRLKVIYAIMRDKVPYAAWRAAESHSAQRPRWRGPARALPQEPGNASIGDWQKYGNAHYSLRSS